MDIANSAVGNMTLYTTVFLPSTAITDLLTTLPIIPTTVPSLQRTKRKKTTTTALRGTTSYVNVTTLEPTTNTPTFITTNMSSTEIPTTTTIPPTTLFTEIVADDATIVSNSNKLDMISGFCLSTVIVLFALF